MQEIRCEKGVATIFRGVRTEEKFKQALKMARR